MEELKFMNISPLDHRYAGTTCGKKLIRYLSEEARIKYQAEVEKVIVETWEELGIAPQGSAIEVARALQELKAAEVYAEEKKTRHDIRALVHVLQQKVSAGTRPFIHLGVTSYDIIDTARSCQLKDVTGQVVLPLLKELLSVWLELAWRERNTVQVGRTHGQHAVPTTFGYLVIYYCLRLSEAIKKIISSTKELKGKISGPVGAYNGLSLLYGEAEIFEARVLEKLSLQPAGAATQIIPHEAYLHLFHHLIAVLGILADFSDDLRHLQRTEIGEVAEEFNHDQVGSSTMPQKQNPISFENVKSMWKNFLPRIITLYLDQLSEHQRDLTNSASSRFYGEIIAGVVLSAERLLKVSKKLKVREDRMKKNLNLSEGYILAEAAYLLLAKNGCGDAHERIRKISLWGRERGLTFFETIKARQDELEPLLGEDWMRLLELVRQPERYTGIARRKVEKMVLELAGAHELKIELT